jgi:hypothetical protein
VKSLYCEDAQFLSDPSLPEQTWNSVKASVICYFSNPSPPMDTKISQSLAMLMEDLKKKRKKKVQYKSEPILNNKKCLRALSQKENIGI